jgi:DNA repair ATPase RecN
LIELSIANRDVAGNNGAEDLVTEAVPYLLTNLLRQIRVIEQINQNAEELDRVAKCLPNRVNEVDELIHTRQGEWTRINRNKEVLSGDKSILGQEAEGGRTINDDKVDLLGVQKKVLNRIS